MIAASRQPKQIGAINKMPKQKLLPQSLSKMISVGVSRPSELELYDLSRTAAENLAQYALQMRKWEVARSDAVAEMQRRLEHIARNFFGAPDHFTRSLEGKTIVLWMIAREFLPGLRTSELRRRRISKKHKSHTNRRWTPESLEELFMAVLTLKGNNPNLSDVAACLTLIRQCKKDPSLSALRPLILAGSKDTNDVKRAGTLSNVVSRARKLFAS